MEIIQIIVEIILILSILGFFGSLFLKAENEKHLSQLAFTVVLINNILIISAFFIWMFIHFVPFNIFLFNIIKNEHYSFGFDLIWDINTVVFLLVGNIITLIIVYFSRYYMHRENGYKRFFNTILFFYLGYTITVLAGNFITLFIGWEFLGLSSFLLIAFYRDRYLPVRNAVKVFSVYRIGDVGMIMAMWALHHLVKENLLFYTLNKEKLVIHYFENQSLIGTAIALCLFITAIGKSAQFPFSYWLPRAMEGPTPSSAIFYGSLSVHMGVLLLIRTYYIWETQWLPRVLFALLGIITALMANTTARVQSSVKTQIAYSSIAQIGIMFIELALGLKWLVLIHFASNAFLRTYQLLMSPSMVIYLMRQQVYYSKLIDTPTNIWKVLPDSIYYTIYVLAQKEYNLDFIVNHYIFGTFKKIGRITSFITPSTLMIYILPLFGMGIFFYITKVHFPVLIEHLFPEIFALIAVILSMRAFSERMNPLFVIYLIISSQLFVLLAISYNEKFEMFDSLLYLSGIILGGIISVYTLIKLKSKEENYFDLNKYYGHVYEHRLLAFVFLFGIICMIGFPATPTFIGEDVILEHIHSYQFPLAFLIALNLIIIGITGIKIYARLFLGPHCKPTHEIAIKSA